MVPLLLHTPTATVLWSGVDRRPSVKALVCLDCGDIRALSSDESVACRCQNASARWLDPVRGTVEVSARDRQRVRILGIHNQFLQLSTQLTQNQQWAEWHDLVTGDADGYLFHKDKRNCWVALVRVGESSDTFWAEENL